MRIVIGYVLAVLAAYLVGCVVVSQGNIASVVALGFDVTLSQRIDSAIHDIANMTPIYLPLIAISFLIALPVSAWVISRFPHLKRLGYVLGGCVALIAIHVILKTVLGLSGVATTRTLAGLLAQGLAGAIGGYCYYRAITWQRQPSAD